MKKLILTTILVGLLVVPALGNPTGSPDNLPNLSTWVGGNTTHQYWTFSSGNVAETVAGTSWNADPEELVPVLSPLTFAVISADPGTLSWRGDSTDGTFYGDDIKVHLKITNFENDNAFKLIWVDVGYDGSGPLEVTSVSASDHGSTEYESWILPGEGDADFGIRIEPNPYFEEIHFTIPGQSGAELYYIHADTVCIPAPGAILLGGIGVCLVGWLRRRRTL